MQLSQKRKTDKYLGYLLIALLLPITRLLGMTLKRDHSLKQEPDTILFIKILGLGSLVLSSESINLIRKKFPNTKFILLTDVNISKGIDFFHLFDETWPIRSESFICILFDSMKFIFRSWQLKRLWVIDLEVYSKLTTVYSLFTLALNRFGFFLSPVFFRKYLNTHNIFFNQFTFLEDNYTHMAEIVTTSENLSAVPFLSPRSNEASLPYIVLNNTCSNLAPVRKLPEAAFNDICYWILKHTSYKIAISGAPKDREEISLLIERDPVLFASRQRILNLSGSLDFTSYYKFLSEQCICMISIDSAPLHIARKLNIPTLSLWGPTDPNNYLKIHPGEENKHLFYYTKVSCSPCIHHFEKLPCNGNNFCMKDMQVKIIIEKIQALLNTIKA